VVSEATNGNAKVVVGEMEKKMSQTSESYEGKASVRLGKSIGRHHLEVSRFGRRSLQIGKKDLAR